RWWKMRCITVSNRCLPGAQFESAASCARTCWKFPLPIRARLLRPLRNGAIAWHKTMSASAWRPTSARVDNCALSRTATNIACRSPCPAWRATMRVAIVDDEPLARERLRALLAELALGEVVGEGASGLDAVALAHDLKPDVMLLDIRMPGMDGLEAA